MYQGDGSSNIEDCKAASRNSISKWYDGTHISGAIRAKLSPQRNGELMENIGSFNLSRRFSFDLIRKLNPESSRLYFNTSIPSRIM